MNATPSCKDLAPRLGMEKPLTAKLSERLSLAAMAPRRKPLKNPYDITWPGPTELVGLRFTLQPMQASQLHADYTKGLHAWFLKQVQQTNPALSQRLHDNADEKAFTISALDGQFVGGQQQLQLYPKETYAWTVTAFSQELVYWLGRWLAKLPEALSLYHAPLKILNVEVAQPAMTYEELTHAPLPRNKKLALSFPVPTSFRRKGKHFPLPTPVNLFHSYGRRWNNQSAYPVELDPFLDWVDTHTVIHRYSLQTSKVTVGKGQGAVTGFMGALELGLDKKAETSPENMAWFYRLGQYAPYCGTGHKTTFGLGQTLLGWELPAEQELPISAAAVLEERISDLTEIFLAQKARQGGKRGIQSAKTWATILARREQGESLMLIANDLNMKHDTVNKYAKLARKALRETVNI